MDTKLFEDENWSDHPSTSSTQESADKIQRFVRGSCIECLNNWGNNGEPRNGDTMLTEDLGIHVHIISLRGFDWEGKTSASGSVD